MSIYKKVICSYINFMNRTHCYNIIGKVFINLKKKRKTSFYLRKPKLGEFFSFMFLCSIFIVS